MPSPGSSMSLHLDSILLSVPTLLLSVQHVPTLLLSVNRVHTARQSVAVWQCVQRANCCQLSATPLQSVCTPTSFKAKHHQWWFTMPGFQKLKASLLTDRALDLQLKLQQRHEAIKEEPSTLCHKLSQCNNGAMGPSNLVLKRCSHFLPYFIVICQISVRRDGNILCRSYPARPGLSGLIIDNFFLAIILWLPTSIICP